jgi:EmrB/QacA subfamily drug resistance transporter
MPQANLRIARDFPYMQYKWIALSVTTVGTLMAGIDARIIVVGLPTVARELGADVESIIWVSQSYLLASTVGLLLIGRITDVIGRVKIYNIGFVVFTIGSALASISQSPAQLILSRIVQGTGSAMLITNSAAILTDATPSTELGTILGINQIAFRVGSVAGLTLSGVIIAVSDWRALFYLNIPIGIFGTVWAHLRLREISTKDVQKKMDWLGFATFTSGLTFVLLAITLFTYGKTEDLPGFAMLALGGILLLYFVRVENRKSAPLLDLHLFKIREFAAGNTAQLLNALAWFGIVLMLSFYMQVVLDLSPLKAGLSLLPLEGAFVLAGPISGRLSDKYGARLFSTLGLSIGSVGFFLLTQVNISTPYSNLILPLILLGVGNGMFVSPNISSIMRSVPPNRRGVASGFRTTLFNVGGTASAGLGILLITTGIPYSLFSNLLRSMDPASLGQVPEQEFITGFKVAAFVFAIINTCAIIPSFLRGPGSGSLAEMSKGPEEDETRRDMAQGM